MTKCDFCPYAHLKNGKLYCPHSLCLLPKDDILTIAKALGTNAEQQERKD